MALSIACSYQWKITGFQQIQCLYVLLDNLKESLLAVPHYYSAVHRSVPSPSLEPVNVLH